MQVKCGCGKMLNVPDALAGKSARCPACLKVFNVPGAPPAGPPQAVRIQLQCSCGRRLSAPTGAAGKKVLCPQCNRELAIPSPPAPAQPAAPPPKAAPAPPDDIEPFLDEPPADAPEPKQPPEEGQKQAQYGLTASKCPNCKANLDLGAQFCVECGTALATGKKVESATTKPKTGFAALSRQTKKTIAVAAGVVIVLSAAAFYLVRKFSTPTAPPPRPSTRHAPAPPAP